MPDMNGHFEIQSLNARITGKSTRNIKLIMKNGYVQECEVDCAYQLAN